MKDTQDQLKDTLAYFGLTHGAPYFISGGHPLTAYPEQVFRIDYYSFSMCYQGEMLLRVDQQEFRVLPGMILAARPGTLIRIISHSPDFSMKLLCFEKTFLPEHLTDRYLLDQLNIFQGADYRMLYADATQTRTWRDMLDYLEQKAQRDGPYQNMQIASLIQYLVLETASIYHSQSPDSVSLTGTEQSSKQLYWQFYALVQQHIPEQKQLHFYARELAVSEAYLIHSVRSASGKTPGQIIAEALLKEAYLRLHNPDNNISEVAFQLQFSSTAAFSRFFKRSTGINPQDYRRQHLG